jgi:hypothetical protein
MVARMSHTPTLGLIDCLLSASNSTHVKYSPMFTQMIVASIAIHHLLQFLIATRRARVKMW